MRSVVMDAKLLKSECEELKLVREGELLHLDATRAMEGQLWAELSWDGGYTASVLLVEWVMWHQEGLLRVESSR